MISWIYAGKQRGTEQFPAASSANTTQYTRDPRVSRVRERREMLNGGLHAARKSANGACSLHYSLEHAQSLSAHRLCLCWSPYGADKGLTLGESAAG